MFEKLARKFKEWKQGSQYLEGDLLVDSQTQKIWMVLGKTAFVENHLWIVDVNTTEVEWVSIRNIDKGVMTRLSGVGKALHDL